MIAGSSRRLVLLLAVVLVPLRPHPCAAATPEQATQKCRQQLKLLSEALGNYRQDHEGAFPASLGVLLRGYVSDPSLLRCPAALEHGSAGTANPGLIVPGEKDGKVVGYTWEMSQEDPEFWAGQTFGMSFARFKELQRLSLIGKYVPVIRCSHHGVGRVLNLTEDGTIYESGEYWEGNFVDLLPVVRFEPGLIERANQPMFALLRARPVKASHEMLDLRRWSNARFEDPWVMGDPKMEQLQPDDLLGNGLITNRGIAFDAAGIIQLNGKINPKGGWEGYSSLMYPKAVKSITIKRPFRVMHVLGAVQFEDPIGTSVGTIEFHRTDLPSERWTWRYGVDVLNYRVGADGSEPQLKSTVVAWAGEFLHPEARKEKPRLFHLQFVTAQPDIVVDHIDFLGGDGFSSPFIAAITLE